MDVEKAQQQFALEIDIQEYSASGEAGSLNIQKAGHLIFNSKICEIKI